MSFGHALYYPHINLTNKNWLKHSYLFWDKLSRIVPNSVEPTDSEEIIKLRSETNFLNDYSPDSWDISQAFQDFSRFLIDFGRSNRFNEYYLNAYPNHPSRYHRREFRENPQYRRDFLREIALTNGTYLHIQKLDQRMKEVLFDIGLAIPGENEWEDWIKIDNEIGFIYMSYLAKSISKQRTLPLVTDTEHSFVASSSFTPEVFNKYNAEFEHKLGNLLITSFIPKNINSVTFEQLIKVKNKYSDEHSAFFDSINELCANIPEIDNKSALEDALNHHSKSLIANTQNLKSAYESNKIETVSKFLTISLPSTLLSLSTYVPVEYKPLGIGAGLLFGLASSINSIKQDRSNLQQQPLSYLLSINSELSGEGLLRRLNDTVKGIRRI